MNINTKAVIASTLLTALLAGTSAMAEDVGFDVLENFDSVTTEVVVIQNVSLQSADIDTDYSVGPNR